MSQKVYEDGEQIDLARQMELSGEAFEMASTLQKVLLQHVEAAHGKLDNREAVHRMLLVLAILSGWFMLAGGKVTRTAATDMRTMFDDAVFQVLQGAK